MSWKRFTLPVVTWVMFRNRTFQFSMLSALFRCVIWLFTHIAFSVLIEVYIGGNQSAGDKLSLDRSLRPQRMPEGRRWLRENNCHIVATTINFEVEQLWVVDRQNLFHILWALSWAEGEVYFTFMDKEYMFQLIYSWKINLILFSFSFTCFHRTSS